MLNAQQISDAITFAFNAHDVSANRAKDRFRKFDKKTPYAVHPTWLSLTMLHEAKIPEDKRILFFYVLLYHDVLEDTTAKLPDDTPPEVVKLVNEMTFTSSKEERTEIWKRSQEAILLKVFDKTSNLMNCYSDKKLEDYRQYIPQLITEAEKHYPDLNIYKIVKGLLE